LKDAEFRATLSDAERAELPAHPAGPIELTDDELDESVGGRITSYPIACPPTFTYSMLCCQLR
jgi:mersacidin/lichenicidin family type 2 lantibiotic